jgi:hypothetical protein
MPWTSNDAERHTRKTTTSELKELWAKVANESLERTGDEGRAIRQANAVVGRQAKSSSWQFSPTKCGKNIAGACWANDFQFLATLIRF